MVCKSVSAEICPGGNHVQSPRRRTVIGLGSMGLGMARSLLRGGHEVHGFDVGSAALAALRDAGGKAC